MYSMLLCIRTDILYGKDIKARLKKVAMFPRKSMPEVDVNEIKCWRSNCERNLEIFIYKYSLIAICHQHFVAKLLASDWAIPVCQTRSCSFAPKKCFHLTWFSCLRMFKKRRSICSWAKYCVRPADLSLRSSCLKPRLIKKFPRRVTFRHRLHI